MKKIYLILAMVFLAGHLVAQSNLAGSTVQNSNTVTSGTYQVNAELSDLPGFPMYRNTGNQTQDETNYAAAKENWVAENKDIYNLFKNGQLVKSTVVLTGFPSYVITGNSEADYTNYKAARTLWMNENEALYREYLKSIQK